MPGYREYFVVYSPTFKSAATSTVISFAENVNGSIFMAHAVGDYVFTCRISEPADVADFNLRYRPTGIELPTPDDASADAIFRAITNLETFDAKGSKVLLTPETAGERAIAVTDLESVEILRSIEMELKKLNFYMYFITNIQVTDDMVG